MIEVGALTNDFFLQSLVDGKIEITHFKTVHKINTNNSPQEQECSKFKLETQKRLIKRKKKN